VETGALDGVLEGETVGIEVKGELVGSSEGRAVGISLGEAVGSEATGETVGSMDGVGVGISVTTRAAEHVKLQRNCRVVGVKVAGSYFAHEETCSKESDSSLAMMRLAPTSNIHRKPRVGKY